jgi:hypothetical protein
MRSLENSKLDGRIGMHGPRTKHWQLRDETARGAYSALKQARGTRSLRVGIAGLCHTGTELVAAPGPVHGPSGQVLAS